MLFALICIDKPGSLDLRLATRDRHLAFIRTYPGRVQLGGPLLDGDGRPCGSLLLVEAADRAEAAGFAEADPYGKVGLFESVMVRPFRTVVRDGEVLD